jgi:hypothetical protein
VYVQMERTDAFRTLELDSGADGQAVTHAYWTLVREAQERAVADPQAQREIDRLNDAYATLVPNGSRVAVRRAATRAGTSEPVWLDTVIAWIGDEALRTRERWPHRNPEIAVIGGGALSLGLLALVAGAPLLGVGAALALVFGAIWAPWR